MRTKETEAAGIHKYHWYPLVSLVPTGITCIHWYPLELTGTHWNYPGNSHALCVNLPEERTSLGQAHYVPHIPCLNWLWQNTVILYLLHLNKDEVGLPTMFCTRQCFYFSRVWLADYPAMPFIFVY